MLLLFFKALMNFAEIFVRRIRRSTHEPSVLQRLRNDRAKSALNQRESPQNPTQVPREPWHREICPHPRAANEDLVGIWRNRRAGGRRDWGLSLSGGVAIERRQDRGAAMAVDFVGV